MQTLQPFQIIYAPNDIFRQKTKDVKIVDDVVRGIADRMVKTMYAEGAVGIGANMVGVTESIVVVDLRENGEHNPYIFINPKITYYSKEMQIFKEGSLSFPGITAAIERPSSIKLSYLDDQGQPKELEATGFFATVIQHEVDYLNGIIYLDYISKMKRDMLLKKMEKHIEMNPPHVHGAHCHH